MTETTVCALRPEDAGEAARVAATGPDAWTEKAFLEELDSGCGRVFCLKQGTRLLGVAAYQLVLDEASLLTLTVDAAQRGNGFGEALLRGSLGLLKREGAALCFLEVRAKNAPALGLYEKLGFARTGLRRGFYRNPPEDAVLMQLALPESFGTN